MQIGKELVAQGQSLAVAESCMGGGIAERMTQHAGASAFSGRNRRLWHRAKNSGFRGSGSSYQNTWSGECRGGTSHGRKTQALFQTDFALATTGNAGPTTSEGKAPVGRVYLALAHPQGCVVEAFTFGNHRERVIQKAINKAFEMLFRQIQGSKSLLKFRNPGFGDE